MGKKPSAVLLNDQHIFLQVQVGLTMTTLTQDHFPQWDCFFFFFSAINKPCEMPTCTM